MTKITPVLHRIHDLHGNICKAEVDEIKRVIAITRSTDIAERVAVESDLEVLETYILGPKPGTDGARQLNTMNDAELLELWETEERPKAIRLKDVGNIAYTIQTVGLQIDSEATEISDWKALPDFEIEGQEDDVLIEIDRDALETRLVALDLALQNAEADNDSPYLTALTEGLKGYQDFTIDDLRREWADSRDGFYRKMAEGDLTIMMEYSDPEFGK